jgi:predicted transcriptional regulator/ADP-ribose pyrophosphatase YjhB (NUDIX family)
MTQPDIHRAQMSILRSLRKSNRCRYTDLRLPTGLDSDVFKFHLRKLISLGLITKDESQHYMLTPSGKEFANNLDDGKRTIQKQPKLSILFFAESADKKQYLFQQRKRHPFYNYWGLLSGPAKWGVDFLETARHEFEKQTGTTAEYEVSTFIRQCDYATDSKEVLEDKLFVVVKVTAAKGEIKNIWTGGYNRWMTLDELESCEKYFTATRKSIEHVTQQDAYSSIAVDYQIDEY